MLEKQFSNTPLTPEAWINITNLSYFINCLEPWGGASLYFRGLIGRIYTKYIKCKPHGFREDFLSFFYYKSMEIDLWGGGSLDPRGLIGRIYGGDN